ncbi:hypothetical protein RFI_11692 [Reticulomyxa filosa]|uniref:Beta-adaptin appendage C-terminal subdomain domain-containing protein n=1 Tax=Reticulomyxa filosa TaxID=46433 RepID=X6NIB4_RETFI|nr:hypothetical protein RFI_11692 [Reticulomyxa filosa]|eukprot:ETO25444.1 hypothetical protein RFI_11692 [Reticulomyxa filosa]
MPTSLLQTVAVTISTNIGEVTIHEKHFPIPILFTEKPKISPSEFMEKWTGSSEKEVVQHSWPQILREWSDIRDQLNANNIMCIYERNVEHKGIISYCLCVFLDTSVFIEVSLALTGKIIVLVKSNDSAVSKLVLLAIQHLLE